MMLGQRLFSWASPTDRLTVLIFHRVLAARDELWPEEWVAQEFEQVCRWVAQWFQVLPLDEAAERLVKKSLPRRAACITFDDGYADNHAVACPILARHGLCATFFVSTGFLNGGRMWNDTLTEAVRRTQREVLEWQGPHLRSLGAVPTQTTDQKRTALRALIRSIKHLHPSERAEAIAQVLESAGVCASELSTGLMMSSEQVRALRTSGMQIGAHTVTHPILAKLSEDESEREIGTSRDVLENLIGERVRLFAYPNGRPGEDYGPRDVALVRRFGFSAAVSTAYGAANSTTDRFQLPRFTPWDRGQLKFGLRLARQLAFGGQPAAV
jgi:peptidoglycan/xylan/chitin deacetylase (PgdA/CDA1 family)